MRNARNAVFVDLAGARTIADAQSRIAHTLGVAEGALDEALTTRAATLLILDAAEHLRGQLPAARWCAGHTRLLITSRARLGFDGEAVIEVAALEPGDGEAMFRDRAARAGATVDDRAIVSKLVQELEGNALAIELAAARMRIMSPDELLSRLVQHLDALGAPLRSAIAASFELLAAHEQAVLVQLGVFAGTFSLDAAEAIVRAEGSLIDVLGSLRDQSLLRREEGLSLSASVRAFAAERLERLPEKAVRARHVAYFREQGLRAANAWNRRGDKGSLRALMEMREDLALAMHGAEGEARVACAFALATAITAHGPFDRELEVAELGAAVAINGAIDGAIDGDLAVQMREARARAIGVAGRVRESIDELRAIAPLARDPILAGEIRVQLGTRLRQVGEMNEATRVYRDAEQLLRGSETRAEAGALASLGRIETDAGNLAVGRELNTRARALARAIGDRVVEGLSAGNLAQLEQELGRYDEARARYDEALAALRSVRDPRYAAIYAGYRGDLDYEPGDLDSAEKRYRAAIDDLERARVPRGIGLFRGALGAVLARRGERARAEEELDRAEAILRGVHDPSALCVVALHRLLLGEDDAPPGGELTTTEIRFAARMVRKRPRGGEPSSRSKKVSSR